MSDTFLVNIHNNFDERHIILTISNNFQANDLVNQLIKYYNLPTTNYVYSLYLDEHDFDFIQQTSCLNRINNLNEIDYIEPNTYLYEYLVFCPVLDVKLIQEYKIIYIIKQYLRCFNLI